jgi:hypothetical protein
MVPRLFAAALLLPAADAQIQRLQPGGVESLDTVDHVLQFSEMIRLAESKILAINELPTVTLKNSEPPLGNLGFVGKHTSPNALASGSPGNQWARAQRLMAFPQSLVGSIDDRTNQESQPLVALPVARDLAQVSNGTRNGVAVLDSKDKGRIESHAAETVGASQISSRLISTDSKVSFSPILTQSIGAAEVHLPNGHTGLLTVVEPTRLTSYSSPFVPIVADAREMSNEIGQPRNQSIGVGGNLIVDPVKLPIIVKLQPSDLMHYGFQITELNVQLADLPQEPDFNAVPTIIRTDARLHRLDESFEISTRIETAPVQISLRPSRNTVVVSRQQSIAVTTSSQPKATTHDTDGQQQAAISSSTDRNSDPRVQAFRAPPASLASGSVPVTDMAISTISIPTESALVIESTPQHPSETVQKTDTAIKFNTHHNSSSAIGETLISASTDQIPRVTATTKDSTQEFNRATEAFDTTDGRILSADSSSKIDPSSQLSVFPKSFKQSPVSRSAKQDQFVEAIRGQDSSDSPVLSEIVKQNMVSDGAKPDGLVEASSGHFASQLIHRVTTPHLPVKSEHVRHRRPEPISAEDQRNSIPTNVRPIDDNLSSPSPQFEDDDLELPVELPARTLREPTNDIRQAKVPSESAGPPVDGPAATSPPPPVVSVGAEDVSAQTEIQIPPNLMLRATVNTSYHGQSIGDSNVEFARDSWGLVQETIVSRATDYVERGRMVVDADALRFEIQVEPPELGKLRILLADSNGAIMAHIVADHDVTLTVLERELPALKQSLQEAGIDNVDVGVSQDESAARQWHNVKRPSIPVVDSAASDASGQRDPTTSSAHHIDLIV